MSGRRTYTVVGPRECVVYITHGLAETLLRFARERDPDQVTISLSVTEASEFEDIDLPDDTAVFTHFYLPDAGKSVNFVFGVDLGTPPGQTQGRFVSHPTGERDISMRDDLAQVVFVAVPPWEPSSLSAFDRHGRTLELDLVDAEPPEETMAD
jgi:hypothetical protein